MRLAGRVTAKPLVVKVEPLEEEAAVLVDYILEDPRRAAQLGALRRAFLADDGKHDYHVLVAEALRDTSSVELLPEMVGLLRQIHLGGINPHRPRPIQEKACRLLLGVSVGLEFGYVRNDSYFEDPPPSHWRKVHTVPDSCLAPFSRSWHHWFFQGTTLADLRVEGRYNRANSRRVVGRIWAMGDNGLPTLQARSASYESKTAFERRLKKNKIQVFGTPAQVVDRIHVRFKQP